MRMDCELKFIDVNVGKPEVTLISKSIHSILLLTNVQILESNTLAQN